MTRDDASARFTVVSMGSFSGQFVYLRSTSGTHGDTSDLLQGGTQVVTTSNEIWYVHDRPSGIEDTDVGFGPGDDRNGHRDLRLRGPDHDVFIDPDARAGGGVWQDGAVLDWTGVRNGQQDGRYALPPHILSARYDRAVDPSIVHLFVTVQTGFHTPSSDRPGGQDGEDDGWTVRRKACHATYPCDVPMRRVVFLVFALVGLVTLAYLLLGFVLRGAVLWGWADLMSVTIGPLEGAPF